MDAQKIGDNVRARRTALGLTQDELARRSGFNSNTISRIELGKNDPLMPTLGAIAKALGCSLFDLTGEHEAPIISQPPSSPPQPSPLSETLVGEALRDAVKQLALPNSVQEELWRLLAEYRHHRVTQEYLEMAATLLRKNATIQEAYRSAVLQQAKNDARAKGLHKTTLKKADK